MLRSVIGLFRNFSSSSAPATESAFSRESLRTGALGIKKGMMSYWDNLGLRHAVTILHVQAEVS